jgi:hypothetical protein
MKNGVLLVELQSICSEKKERIVWRAQKIMKN